MLNELAIQYGNLSSQMVPNRFMYDLWVDRYVSIQRMEMHASGQLIIIIVFNYHILQLARQGLDVVIMSRSQEKLQKVADEIST